MKSRASALIFYVALAEISRIASAFVVHGRTARLTVVSHLQATKQGHNNDDEHDDDDDDDDNNNEWAAVENPELITQEDDDDDDDGKEEWLPDRERAKQKREAARVYAEKVQAAAQTQKSDEAQSPRPSAYTDEEEEVIAAMGGKTHHPERKRESGFLGDSTLGEIATDYSVPICYIADVLCMWGVTPPIHVQDRLGDLVTGEQAFSLLEAVNSLDISALHDRYSNTNLLNLAGEWDIDLQQAFEMAMREGWSLPFGVQTCLRVEQEEELIRVLGNPMAMRRDGFDGEEEEDDDDY